MADEYEFMDTQDISENGPNTSEDSVNAEEDNESNDANDADGAEGDARAIAQASFSDAAKKVASKGMKVAILPSAKGKAKSEKTTSRASSSQSATSASRSKSKKTDKKRKPSSSEEDDQSSKKIRKDDEDKKALKYFISRTEEMESVLEEKESMLKEMEDKKLASDTRFKEEISSLKNMVISLENKLREVRSCHEKEKREMENENRKRREEYERIYSVRSQQETRQLLEEANATLNHASGSNVVRKAADPLVMAPQGPVFVGNGQLGHGTMQQERHQNSPLNSQMVMYPAVGQAGIQYGVQVQPAQVVGVSNRDVRELRVCSNSPCTRSDCKFVHVPAGNNNNWIYNGVYYDNNFYRRNPQSQRQPNAGKEIPAQDEWKDVVLPVDGQFYLNNDFYSNLYRKIVYSLVYSMK